MSVSNTLSLALATARSKASRAAAIAPGRLVLSGNVDAQCSDAETETAMAQRYHHSLVTPYHLGITACATRPTVRMDRLLSTAKTIAVRRRGCRCFASMTDAKQCRG